MGSPGADVVKTSGGSVDGAAPDEATVRGVSRVLTAADAAPPSCSGGSGGLSVSKVLTAADAVLCVLGGADGGADGVAGTASGGVSVSCCDGSKRVSVSKVLTAAGAAVQLEVPPLAIRRSSSARCVSSLVSTATRSFMMMMLTNG